MTCLKPLSEGSHRRIRGSRASIGILTCLLLLFACSRSTLQSAPCPTGHERCDKLCTQLASDPRNCGACGASCQRGEVCVDGLCSIECPPGYLVCGERCVDPETNPLHCGGCGRDCTSGENIRSASCESGTCRLECSEGWGDCTEEPGCETDLRKSAEHCGTCGQACGDEELCSNGDCLCRKPLVRCGDACVDPERDLQNCGGCGAVCEAGANTEGLACRGGRCTFTCVEGFADCDGDPSNGCEADLSDPATCGTCSQRCEAGVDCVQGRCGCPEGLFACMGECVSYDDDIRHCGQCGNACNLPHAGSATCDQGVCSITCDEGFVTCPGTAECFVDLRNDPQNCGACGTICQSGKCVGGRCQGFVRHLSQGHAPHKTCVIDHDGDVYCWGWEEWGPPGQPDTSNFTPVHVAHIPLAAEVDVGRFHVCVRRNDGRALCWGTNNRGQLGNGTRDYASTPEFVLDEDGAILQPVRSIHAGYLSSCALMESGTVKCWGHGHDLLQKGGDKLRATTVLLGDPPAPVPPARQLTLGSNHACALLEDRDKVFCWGNSYWGQLGLGIVSETATETHFGEVDLEGVVQIDCNIRHCCARLRDGSLSCWGEGVYGQLGDDGTREDRPIPGPVLGLDQPVLHVSTGQSHTCALLADGTASCWGVRGHGALGNPDPTIFRSTPAPVLRGSGEALDGIVTLMTGAFHSCALTSHELYCWGWNKYGQLGVGAHIGESFEPLLVDWSSRSP